MSSKKSIFAVLAFMALGFWYPLSSYGFGTKSTGTYNGGMGENYNLILSCNWDITAPGQWTATPGDANSSPPVPPKLIHDIPLAHCVGVRKSTGEPFASSNNAGDFHIKMVYNLLLCHYSDLNKGGGNEVCQKFNDPDNPNAGSTNVSSNGLQSGVYCQNENTGGSTTTWAVYCEKGVDPDYTVDIRDSYIRWVDPHPSTAGDMPPIWTNCPVDGIFTNGKQCEVIAGGLPTETIKVKGVTQSVVSDSLCKQIFPALDINGDAAKHLNEKEVAHFEAWHPDPCVDDLTPPSGPGWDPQNKGGTRACDSASGPMYTPNAQIYGQDGFDDTFRRCPAVIAQ